MATKSRTSKKQAAESANQIQPLAVYSREELMSIFNQSRHVFIRAENAGDLVRQAGPGNARYAGVNVLKWLGVDVSELHIHIHVANQSEPHLTT